MAAKGSPDRKKKALEAIAEANRELAKLQLARFQTMSRRCAPEYEHLSDGGEFTRDRSVDSLLLKLSTADFDPSAFASHSSAESLEVAVESFARQVRLLRKRAERTFDVFLSYNSDDRAEVRTIAKYLQSAGLLPWIDEDELRPGRDWMSQLQLDIERVASCAVVVGRSGLGPWQGVETKSALQLFVDKHLAVVPVLLPTCSAEPQLPIFLRSFGWVDFRKLDPDPIGQLVRAVQAIRPKDA
jgi:hypothetical protein